MFMYPLPEPVDVYSDASDSEQPTPAPSTPSTPIEARYCFPPLGNEIGRTEVSGEIVIERDVVGNQWFREMAADLTTESRKVQQEFQNLRHNLKELGYQYRSCAVQLEEEKKNCSNFIKAMKRFLDPFMLKETLQIALYHLEQGDEDDDGMDEDESASDSEGDSDDDGDDDGAPPPSHPDLKGKGRQDAPSSPRKRTREESLDSEEEREVELSVEYRGSPVSPKRQRRDSGEEPDGDDIRFREASFSSDTSDGNYTSSPSRASASSGSSSSSSSSGDEDWLMFEREAMSEDVEVDQDPSHLGLVYVHGRWGRIVPMEPSENDREPDEAGLEQMEHGATSPDSPEFDGVFRRPGYPIRDHRQDITRGPGGRPYRVEFSDTAMVFGSPLLDGAGSWSPPRASSPPLPRPGPAEAGPSSLAGWIERDQEQDDSDPEDEEDVDELPGPTPAPLRRDYHRVVEDEDGNPIVVYMPPEGEENRRPVPLTRDYHRIFEDEDGNPIEVYMPPDGEDDEDEDDEEEEEEEEEEDTASLIE